MLSSHKAVRYALVILWMAFIFYVSSIPELRSSLPSMSDFILRKLAHITEYAVLTVLLWRAAAESRFRLGMTLGIAFCYAVSDEVHQLYVAGRGGSAIDVLIDSVGIGVAWLGIQKLPRVRR